MRRIQRDEGDKDVNKQAGTDKDGHTTNKEATATSTESTPAPLPNSSPQINLSDFLMGLLQYMGGRDGKQLKELAKSSTQSVCGLVWKKDDTAYKCRTCEMDPTWYVLFDSFLSSPS